jgi:hypothetical protein
MNKKGNIIGVIIILLMLIILIVLFLSYYQNMNLRYDETKRARTESIISIDSANLYGISNSVSQGFSLDMNNNNYWYCNHPIPPDFRQSNDSLNLFTNDLLKDYFRTLETKGYSNNYSNFTHKLLFPEVDSTQIKISGDAVIVTDLSLSMSWSVDAGIKDQIARDMAKILIESAFNESESVRIGIVEYASSALIVHPLTSDKDELINSIYGMRSPNGGTCVSCGIYEAVRMLIPPPFTGTPPQKPLSIVIMSDGVANINFYQDDINPDCILLDDDGGPSDQAREYARQAHEIYNITFYSIGFYSEDDDADGAILMEDIANLGGGDYSESDNPAELTNIYTEFGRAVAEYEIRNFEYMKLDNNMMISFFPLAQIGVDNNFITRTNNFSKSYNLPYSTWYVYKNILNWLLFMGNDLNLLVKDSLIAEKGCQGVFYNSSYGGCPGLGERHISESNIEKMSLTNKDMRPINLKDEITDEINKFMLNYNISCELKYSVFNVSNHFIYDYGPSPNFLNLNQIFGNGTLKIPGDGINPRHSCSDEDNFLEISTGLDVGKLGSDNSVNSCGGSNTYEYIGVDRTVTIILDVSCTHLYGNYIYSTKKVSPLGIKFQLFFDLMTNCEPPEDTNTLSLIC